MKKVIFSVLFGLLLSAGVATAAHAESYETEVEWGVNFRAAPSLDSYVFRMIPKGEDIHVIERVDQHWLKIVVQDGTEGFISDQDKFTNYLHTTPIDEPIITTGYPWLRSEPHTGSHIYRSVPEGTVLTAYSTIINGYVKVSFDGHVGWIHVNYAEYYNGGSTGGSTTAPSKAAWERKADAIINTAKSYIGKVEYDFGERNHARLIYDCSSFTELVYEKHGIGLKWGTRFQKHAGSYVSSSNIRKGDLIFFDTNGNGDINHVGIYMGNDIFIHNSPSGDVHISDLDGFWARAYVTARRVI